MMGLMDKLNGDIVMGLIDILLIATNKMVILRVSPVLYYSVPYLRMISSVLEFKTNCGWYRPLQMTSSVYIFFILSEWCRPFLTLV